MNKIFLFSMTVFFCIFNTLVVHATEDTTFDSAREIASPRQSEQLFSKKEVWAIHGQATNITQQHSDFTSPYSGTNSLNPDGPMEKTTDATLFLGIRLWNGAEIWLNPEIDQGFGFDKTTGVAGFPNGAAYKVGSNPPYFRVQRFFIRQVISLEGKSLTIDAERNQLAGIRSTENVTLTMGKFSVVDIFDTNRYAHDPRLDFMNWAVIEAGAYDYAADPWGFTFGATVEWNHDWWTLRGGVFQLSSLPNGKVTWLNFGENSTNLEIEARH